MFQCRPKVVKASVQPAISHDKTGPEKLIVISNISSTNHITENENKIRGLPQGAAVLFNNCSLNLNASLKMASELRILRSLKRIITYRSKLQGLPELLHSAHVMQIGDTIINSERSRPLLRKENFHRFSEANSDQKWTLCNFVIDDESPIPSISKKHNTLLFIDYCKVDGIPAIGRFKTFAMSKCEVADEVWGSLFDRYHMPQYLILHGVEICAASLFELMRNFSKQDVHVTISLNLTELGLSNDEWIELWKVIRWD